MAKTKTVFICSACGHQESKWLGRCSQCGNWNTFTESIVSISGSSSRQARSERNLSEKEKTAQPINLSDLESEPDIRYSTGISEMDSVLGGGIMKGSAVLIGGEPGIGKSTLLLQILALANTKRTLYISGEESAGQIRLRAERLGISLGSITVLCETRLEKLSNVLQKGIYDLVIVDSIQTIYSEEAGPVSGTVNQIKFSSMELVDIAKMRGTALFIVGHVTKDGGIAGPKAIEHLVDTVLYFDQAENGVRLLRSNKNRFGSVDEIGVFTMTEKGLVPAGNPESFFLGRRKNGNPAGVSAAAVFEGSRTLMVEIQALAVPAKSGYSRIFSDRIDSARVSRTAAILEKHAGLKFSEFDVYVNVAGGIRLTEVGIELPLALALLSAITGKPLKEKLASAGELSLAGEVRLVGHLEKRIAAAEQMGFTEFIGPDLHDAKLLAAASRGIYLACSDVSEAVTHLLSPRHAHT